MVLSKALIIIVTGLTVCGCGRQGRHPAFASFCRPQKVVFCGILMLDLWWYGLAALRFSLSPHGVVGSWEETLDDA